VKNEMQWTVLWFENQSKLWGERSKREDGQLPEGHKPYAIKEQKLWNSFHQKALERFSLHI
jgi:hypothetical protein